MEHPADSTAKWDDFRRQMPVAERWAFFDHAAVSPLPCGTRQVIADWAEDTARNGNTGWMAWANRVEQVRSLAAQLIGSSPDEIALVRNTTEGISLVAEGFPWREGDNVVLPGGEFPSNVYPWLNLQARGVQTRIVPTGDKGSIDLDQLAAACDERTRIVAASWVGYASGHRIDLHALADLAHRRGAYVLVDAIQGLGILPLDVQQTRIDFLAADGHKWLLGPEGAGVFYLRREHLDLLRPFGVGWSSVVHAGNFQNLEFRLKPAAARYEGGTMNMAGFLGLGASLELLLRFGIENIASRVLETAKVCCSRLTEAGAVLQSCQDEPRRSGIVAFSLPGRDPMLVRKHCRDRHVALSCRGHLRISPHAYNNVADVDRLVEALTE